MVIVMINPSLIESSIFLPVKTSHLLYILLLHMTSFWWLILFFTDEIFRLESVLCKKYTNINGKDSKYTNAINISII